MDDVDITNMNDFTEELVRQKRGELQNASRLPRGVCALCGESIGPNLIFCDTDCKSLYERQELIRKRTRR